MVFCLIFITAAAITTAIMTMYIADSLRDYKEYMACVSDVPNTSDTTGILMDRCRRFIE